MGPSIVRGLWVGLLLNLLLVLSIALVRHGEPVHNVHLTTQRDAVVVFGQNSLGFLSLRLFPNWEQAQLYLNQHGLELPIITHTEPGQDLNVEVHRRAENTPYYLIRWNSTSVRKQEPTMMHAPDAESAVALREYVRYSRLMPSLLGFSLQLTNAR